MLFQITDPGKKNSSGLFCLVILGGTRLTLKTGVKTFGGMISFLPQSLPGKIIITYLIRVFDITRGSKFWVLKFLLFGQFSIFHTDLKAIKAFGSVKKVSVLYLSRLLRKPVLKLMPWCQ